MGKVTKDLGRLMHLLGCIECWVGGKFKFPPRFIMRKLSLGRECIACNSQLMMRQSIGKTVVVE